VGIKGRLSGPKLWSPADARPAVRDAGINHMASQNETSDEVEIRYALAAISEALDEWNDLETLRLLRLHWPMIVRFAQARRRDRTRIALRPKARSRRKGSSRPARDLVPSKLRKEDVNQGHTS
jgi:hypothetical protein